MGEYDSLVFALRERVSREDKETACRSAADIIPTLETNRDQAIAELNKALETLGQLRVDLQQAQAERAKQKIRGDNHWETLRSIREFAKKGDCERIIQWVDDAGSGYTQPDSVTMGQLIDERDEWKARAEKVDARVAELEKEYNDAIEEGEMKIADAESRVKELSMQALADEAQHIENFEARKAAEARAEAAEASVKTREAGVDWYCEKLAKVDALNKELQAIVDTQFFGTRKAIEFAQRLDQAESRAALAEKELQEAHLELDRLGAPRDTENEDPLTLGGRLQHFHAIANGRERMLCKSCGTVSNDGQCDCTKTGKTELRKAVNYADAMYDESISVALELVALTAAARKACEAMRPFANAPSHGEYGGPLVQAKLFYECETDMRAGKFHSIDGANFAATRAARAGLAAAIGEKEDV